MTPEGDSVPGQPQLRSVASPRPPEGQVRDRPGPQRHELEAQALELARAKAELERVAAGAAAWFDRAPVAQFSLTAEGRLEQLNRAAAELLQVDAATAAGGTFTAHLDPVSARNFEEHLATVFGTAARQTVAVKLRPRGLAGLRHLLVVSRRVDGEGEGAPEPRCLCAAFDVTEQIQADEAKKQLERQLMNAQRLESLGQLAGGIAHDFNNLLTGVLGHAELLDMSEGLGDGERQCVAMIRKAATTAAKLCQQMLTSAGRSAGTLDAVNLNETLSDAVALVAVSLKRNVSVRQRLDPALGTISGDFAQLNQAVLNLLINAEEAIGEEGGTIEVGTRRARLEPGYRDPSFFGPEVPPGDYVEIWVADTGVGMSPVTLAQIFDPFFTTKFTGRGLGLSTVFGTVRWHNGTVAVRSAPGVGATFRLFLPAQSPPGRAGGAPMPRVRETRSLAGKRILLVEDEDPVRQVITNLLERAGATVEGTRDGYAALDVFRARGAEFTHILLDLTMPGMTGEETLGALKELGRPLPPVVVLSGYASPETQARLSAYGIAGQLQKPCSIVQLAAEIANAG